jgi:protein-tyrosine-phosphatase
LTASADINLERTETVNETQAKPIKILFVCLANLCRSPMAEVIARVAYGGMIQADSAGISPGTGPIFPETAFVLSKFYGVDLSGHKPRHILEFPVANYDYILAMDSPVFMRLSEMKEIPKDKLFGWEVPDPCGLGIEAYERTALQIEDDLEKFVRKIKKDHL